MMLLGKKEKLLIPYREKCFIVFKFFQYLNRYAVILACFHSFFTRNFIIDNDRNINLKMLFFPGLIVHLCDLRVIKTL